MTRTLKRKKHLPNTLRDELKNMLGRTPAQSWLKPEQVSISPVALTPLELLAKLTGYGSLERAELRFVMHSRWAPFPPHASQVQPRPDILERFLGLADAPAEKIHAFASSFGALLIFCRIETVKKDRLVVVESCELWRYFAAAMGSLLRIASCFQAGRRPEAADWDCIGACPPSLVPTVNERYDLLRESRGTQEVWTSMAYFVHKGTDRDRKMWMRFLNALLGLGEVRPWLVWEGSGNSERPKLLFSGPNLLSYLALQLCLRVSQHDALAVCSYCHRQYTPLHRAPKTGQKNFCPECRETGAPVRLAQRARRDRLRAG